jgi:hypothetical protein
VAASTRPLFTCFGYANLGLPLNPRDAFFYQTKPDFFGFTPNPLGLGYRDLGLGTFLRSGFGSADRPNSIWTQFAPLTDGQMQTSTARDVAMVPPQCPTTEAPGPYFQKESTQGNELLIPTPPLPPCAAAVCDVAPTPGPSPVP